MTRAHSLSRLGGRLFPFRLVFGLGAAAGALAWLRPRPFFAPGERLLQALALAVIGGGLVLRAWGAGSAGGHTRSSAIEGRQLATGGPFAYLRNPIYAGSICLGLGMSLLIGDPTALLLAALVFTVLFMAIIPAEEDFLLRQFGAAYREYRESVPRWIPRRSPWPGRTERPFHWPAVLGEGGILLVLLAIYAALMIARHPTPQHGRATASATAGAGPSLSDRGAYFSK